MIVAKKSLGQNFLIDKKILKLIVNLVSIEGKSILEIGPGTGNLTSLILKEKPKEFCVIEKDNDLAEKLSNHYNNKIKIINEDILRINENLLFSEKITVFGNLPYNISTQILAKWIKISKLEQFCKKFILMFQKEVADRIIADTNTKDYGRLSILSNWKMEIEKIIDIEPNSFKPSPKVKSTLLTMVPKKNFYKIKNVKNLEHITNVFFSQRRKMIKKPLKFLFGNHEKITNKLSLNLNLRPQNLDSVTYYKICEIYENLTD